MRGLSPVAASGGHSSSRCAGLSLSRPLLLRSTGSRRAGSAIVAHGLSCSAACGIFPDQGLNPCALHWQADSQPLRHQGSPRMIFICCLMLLPGARRYWWGSGHTQRHQKDSPEATGFPLLFNTGGWEVRLGICSSHSPAAPAHCRWGTPKCVTTSTCWDGLGVCGEGECVAKPPVSPALRALTLAPQGGDHSRHALLQVALGHFT